MHHCCKWLNTFIYLFIFNQNIKIMKRNILIPASIALALAAFSITGCQKDDTTVPVITLNGLSSVTSSLNATYTDEGATANDDQDGDLTASITVTNPVNKDLTGTYTVTYTVTDAAGNTATETRTVIIKNDAEAAWAGTYSVHEDCGDPAVSDYPQVVSASTTINNRITFNKFANYTNNTGIYANITGTNIDLPSQIATGLGLPPISDTHTFSGTGGKTSTGFTITFTDLNTTAGGAAATCTATFTK